MKQTFIWLTALIIGALLPLAGIEWIGDACDFVATIFVRLFRLVAVPTIALAIALTLQSIGGKSELKKIFAKTISYTFLTTIAAAAVGLVLFVAVSPDPLSADLLNTSDSVQETVAEGQWSDHIISVIPDNLLRPFLEGNVLSVLLLAACIGLALNVLARSEDDAVKRQANAVVDLLHGLQRLLYVLIGWIIKILPLGIVAFAAQLSQFVTNGIILGSLGKYVLVILGSNVLQMFVVLPIFLLARGLNPIKVFSAMSPALLMALFTKSSAATLPVTLSSAENRLKANPKVAQFVLPICTTINMNGCAAFILVTSLFIIKSAGIELSLPTMLLWLFLAVISAVGNAGVPMGCYFLTLSLTSDVEGSAIIMGVILPIFTVIDMVETAENVWSDSCVCAMTDKDVKDSL